MPSEEDVEKEQKTDSTASPKRSKKLREPKKVILGTNKEILQAYIQTLTNLQCKKAYMMLREEFSPDRSKYIRYNRLGELDETGLVKLKKAQATRLFNNFGEFAVKWKIKTLHDYIEYLEAHKDESSQMRAKWRRYRDGDHYAVMARGWVHDKFLQENPQPTLPKRIDIFDVKSAADANLFIEQEGLENLSDSPELEYIINKFPSIRDRVLKEIQVNGTTTSYKVKQ